MLRLEATNLVEENIEKQILVPGVFVCDFALRQAVPMQQAYPGPHYSKPTGINLGRSSSLISLVLGTQACCVPGSGINFNSELLDFTMHTTKIKTN